MNKLWITFLALVLSVGAYAQKGKLNAAKSAYEKGDYKTAYSAIEAASEHEKTKDLPETWVYKAQILSMVKASPQLSELMGISVTDEDLESALNKIIELDTDNEYADELEEASKIILQNTHNEGVKAYNDDNDYEQAIVLFEREISLREKYSPNAPIDTIDYLVIGNSAYQLGNNEKVIETYNKLLEMDYQDKNIYYTLMNIYQEDDNDEQYLAVINQAKQQFPDENNFALLEIQYYIDNGRIDEVLDQMIAESEKDPENTSLLLTISSAYEAKEDYQNQYKYAKKAYDIDSESFTAVFNVGVSLFNQGLNYHNELNFMNSNTSLEYKAAMAKRDELIGEAIPYLEKAYELNPESPGAVKSLALYYRITGDKAQQEKFEAIYESLP